jgi:hypothetical protein
MDERALKRLLVIVAVSIIAIMLFKTMMSNTIINLNKAAADKKQAAATSSVTQKSAITDSEVPNIPELPAASAVGEVTTQEPAAASGVGEVR